MINPNYIVADYQNFRIHKNTAGQVLFRGSNCPDLVIQGITIPGYNFSDESYPGSKKPKLTGLKNISLTTPLPVKEGLNRLSELSGKLTNKKYSIYHTQKTMFGYMANFANSVDKIPSLRDRKLYKIVNNGLNTCVFDIGYNPNSGKKEVLKISNVPNYPVLPGYESLTNNFKMLGRNFEPEFDMPIFDAGKIGGIYYYIQAEGTEEGVNIAIVNEVLKKIRKNGYMATTDMDERQVRIYEGKAYLIDPECAFLKDH